MDEFLIGLVCLIIGVWCGLILGALINKKGR